MPCEREPARARRAHYGGAAFCGAVRMELTENVPDCESGTILTYLSGGLAGYV
jgi:hypothetical protein